MEKLNLSYSKPLKLYKVGDLKVKKFDKEMLTLAEYDKLAERAILIYSPNMEIAKYILSHDEDLDWIRFKIMMADWAYDDSRNDNRKIFLLMGGKWAVQNLCRFKLRKGKKTLVSINRSWIKDDDENINFQHAIKDKLDIRAEVMSMFRDEISGKNYDILEDYFVNNINITEIAKIHNRHMSVISKIIKKFKLRNGVYTPKGE